MAMWTCPACARTFGRMSQGHVCAPAMSVDTYYAARPPFEREIFEAVAAHLRELGPLVIEPVGIGILFKRSGTFAELRPKKERVGLAFVLSGKPTHPRIVRRSPMNSRAGIRYWCGIDLRGAQEFDSQVQQWLTEAYYLSPESRKTLASS